MLFSYIFRSFRKHFFPKLNFHKDQVFFKDIALDFLEHNGLAPVLVQSEEEAKAFDIKANPKKYPIYFFETDTSGEKTYEEFYTEKEDIEISQYNSLGFIKTKKEIISFEGVKNDFDEVFDNPKSTKSDIIAVIKKYVLDFEHIETGKHLDQKM